MAALATALQYKYVGPENFTKWHKTWQTQSLHTWVASMHHLPPMLSLLKTGNSGGSNGVNQDYTWVFEYAQAFGSPNGATCRRLGPQPELHSQRLGNGQPLTFTFQTPHFHQSRLHGSSDTHETIGSGRWGGRPSGLFFKDHSILLLPWAARCSVG